MTARVLLIDNYDSFTYNLVQYLRTLGAEVIVHRNDQIALADCLALEPTHVVISPGPGRPEDAGVSMDVLQAFIERGTPMLGVCLGHQALGAVCGGVVKRNDRLMHGKSSMVYHDGQGVYAGLPNPVQVARYHSLVVERETLPPELSVVSYTEEGEIMGLRHRDKPVEGVQFHPESVLTPDGMAMLKNFLGGAEGSP